MSPPRRVVLITNQVTHYRRPFYDALVAAGIDLAIVHGGDPSPNPSWTEHCASQPDLFDPLGRLPTRFLHAHNAQLVLQTFDLRWTGWLLRVLASDRPVVLWGHGLGRSPLGNRLRLRLARRAGALALYEPRGAWPFLRAGVPPRRLIPLHNTQRVEFAHDTSAHPKDALIFVGRLNPNKRVVDLVHAYASLPAHHQRAYQLLIVGEGPDAPLLEAAIRQHGLSDRIVLWGACHDERTLSTLFARAVAFVCPGALGLGILHAFAYGVPVVTHRDRHHGPEIENLVDGENGLRYRGEPRTLGHLLNELLSDPSWPRYLGQLAFQQFQRRPLELMVERMLHAFDVAQEDPT